MLLKIANLYLCYLKAKEMYLTPTLFSLRRIKCINIYTCEVWEIYCHSSNKAWENLWKDEIKTQTS